jgi:hypothetical protein
LGGSSWGAAGSSGDRSVFGRLTLPQLGIRAPQLGLIDTKLADAINGLAAMRLLAAMDQDKLTCERAGGRNPRRA